MPVSLQRSSQFVVGALAGLLALSAAPSRAQGAAPAPADQGARSGGAAAEPAGAPVESTPAQAILMLDYQVVPVPGIASIDLVGFHLLNRMNDWLYLGVGGYAPLLKGEYGGFMAFDVTAHVQHKLVGKLFADAGVSVGGGGGGKSVQQSKLLSGTGGFYKAYAGLGYDLQDLALGVNLSRMKFSNSAIDHSQLNVYLQVPFSYDISPYVRAGETVRASGSAGAGAAGGENMVTIGLDNYSQIDPEGSNKETIHLVDLQFAHFMTRHSYWFFSVGVGYHGLPLYNQVLGGVGYRAQLAPGLNLYGQLGVGSGGYAPDTINTGPGWLVYPRVSAEYMLDKNLGLALTAGYLFAPKGSSKNATFGAALNYHLGAGEGGSTGGTYRGYRFHLFQQTEFDVAFKGIDRSQLKLLSMQADSLVSDHVYLPLQGAVATNAYLGYPGYGELLAGVGVQNRHGQDTPLQVYAQLLVGTNVHGPIAKYGVGLNYGLSDRLALYATAGQTFGLDKDRFRASQVGVGVTYRFSRP